ncbi:MAG TPA: urease accessory protein UreD [Nocardioides sp.]|nr:urease accessory protein UreD [Nocardioides sp.]
MLTSTERLGRTRIRVSPGAGGSRCQVRTATSSSDPTAAVVRPIVVEHGMRSARIALVPEGALLLAGDAIEIDVTVDEGAEVDLLEPGGTVAFDMRGDSARWDVRIDVRPGARLHWGGLPFVVAAGADVARTVRVRCAGDARLALRECLVLGRFGEPPGTLRQVTTVVDGSDRPVLAETLPLDARSAPLLLGSHRVLSSVLSLGGPLAPTAADEHRYDLDVTGAVLWRRLGAQAHDASLDALWDLLGPDGQG